MTVNNHVPRAEALARLGVKPATLYAYVSRSQIRSIPSGDNRHRLYNSEDIERLRSRKRGQIKSTARAESSLRWGEPVLNTVISTVSDGRLIYRNRNAFELVQAGAPFEVVTHFLATGLWQDEHRTWPAIAMPAEIQQQFLSAPRSTTSADLSKFLVAQILLLGLRGRGQAELTQGTAISLTPLLLQSVAACFGLLRPRSTLTHRLRHEPLARYVLRAGGAQVTDERAEALNAALVLIADHELTSATFAARIAASTGADLFGCLAAAHCTHAGTLIGQKADRSEQLLRDLLVSGKQPRTAELIRQKGADLFGFNLLLYPKGDPRVRMILDYAEALDSRRRMMAPAFKFLRRMQEEALAEPGIPTALAALGMALGLPRRSGYLLWTLSRTSGWIAHVLEQRTQAFQLRPRAHFVSAS